jgi:S-(hydroxymethyl)glutathione dehydrogenase / alcohol dehydrogenase
MKAAVCYETGKPLVIEDIQIDPPQKGQVQVRLSATAICHSDIHVLRGELGGVVPLVAGHESAGYVSKVGEGVSSVKEGDAVVVSLIMSCGKCFYCAQGQPHLCEAKKSLQRETSLHSRKGQPIAATFNTGTFAEYTNVDQSQVVKIPADIKMDRAALLACGVITGFGAVVNLAELKAGSSAVIIGVGGVGLNSIQGAAFSGAFPVIAVDVLENKLQAALAFGATHTVNAKAGDPVEAVKKLTAGRGADYVFVTVGNLECMKQGAMMAGKRGLTVLVGLPQFKDVLGLSPFDYIGNEKFLTGCYMGSTNLQVDIPRMVALYLSGKLKLDELITGRFPLEKINEAIGAVERGEALRNVIMFE